MPSSPPTLAPSDGSTRVIATSADGELLAAMADGLDALEILYDRYRTLAFSIAQRITNDPSLAEEVVQDAFLGVWRHAAQYRPDRGSVRTWVTTIVHHRAIDAVRRRRTTGELPSTDGALPEQLQAPDAWQAVEVNLDAIDVERAMAALSPVQRQAIELAYFGGLTQQEIALRIGAPLGTVKSRIRLGLLALRAALEAGDGRSRSEDLVR